MKNFGFLIAFLIGLCANAQGQTQSSDGTVTFVTSRNVYVSFANTEPIQIGDTLHRNQEGKSVPCLVVDKKSSSSCVTHLIGDCKPQKGDVLSHRGKAEVKEVAQIANTTDSVKTPARAQRIRGRVSAGTYSTVNPDRTDNHRAMYRLSLTADNIADSKFSAETYVAYRQLFLPPEEAATRETNFLNIYNLALRYDPTPTMSLALGRKINHRASSLGAIDGLQAEKSFGPLYAGALVGFRPDFSTYGLNTDLLQYGGYVGTKQQTDHLYSETTAGILEQTNAGAIDRRYVYFQHSSTINWKLNIFASAEMDLYNQLDGTNLSDPRLTNLYTSLRYRFSRKLSLTVSYDSRRSVVFYETYRNDVERLLAEDEARQGLRARLYVRPMKFMNVGLSFSKRFQNSNSNPSDNYNAYVSWSRLPKIGGRMSLTINRNESFYLLSQTASLRHSRDLLKRKIGLDLYVRLVDYDYTQTEAFINSKARSQQYYGGAGLNYRYKKTWAFSLLGEFSVRETEQTMRVNARITKRFDSKKRK